MGFFSGPEEQARRANLKKMEDERLAFAQELNAKGFKPEMMLCAQAANGGLIAVCRFEGRQWLIVGPGFGTDEGFALEGYDRFDYRREDVEVKAEGMAGIFGFGKKAERGVEFVITRRDGSEARMPFVFGRNSWGEFKLAKNPLLALKRRRGDANVVWDLRPIETAEPGKILAVTEKYFQ